MDDSKPNNNSTHTKEHKHEGYTVQQNYEIKTSQFPPLYVIYVTCRVMNKARMLLHG